MLYLCMLANLHSELVCVCMRVLQDANKEGETPLALAGDLAAALHDARSNGVLYSNGVDAMEH